MAPTLGEMPLSRANGVRDASSVGLHWCSSSQSPRPVPEILEATQALFKYWYMSFLLKLAVLISLSKHPDALDCPNSFLLAKWYLDSLAASYSSSSVCFLKFIYLFIYRCAESLLLLLPLSSCREWNFSLVVAHRLLIVVASVVAEHGL